MRAQTLSSNLPVSGQSMTVPPKLSTPAEKTRGPVRSSRSRSSRPTAPARTGRGCARAPGFRAARGGSWRRSRSRSARTASRSRAPCRRKPTTRCPRRRRRTAVGARRCRSRGTGCRGAPHSACPRRATRRSAGHGRRPHDLAEEVVRREEHEAAAEVADSPGRGRRALGHVLGVAREDDQIVRLRGAPRRRRSARCPRRRRCRRRGRARRASGGTGPRSCGSARGRRGAGGGGQVDPLLRPQRVPGVAEAVAVAVVEVVGLPRRRRQDDRDPLRRRRRAHDERREPEMARRAFEPGGVEAAPVGRSVDRDRTG